MPWTLDTAISGRIWGNIAPGPVASFDYVPPVRPTARETSLAVVQGSARPQITVLLARRLHEIDTKIRCMISLQAELTR